MKLPRPSWSTVALWSGSLLALALAVACSDSNPGAADGGLIESDDAVPPMDGGKDSTTSDACAYSPAHNDPTCPATYSYTYGGQACAPVGLQCAYPGAGDGEPNGCFATAVLICTGDGGPGDLDAGEDGGREGTWIFGQ